MFIEHGLPSEDASSLYRGFSLLDGGMDRLESVEPLLEQWAQPVVGFYGVGEESIASCGGQVKRIEESGAGRLLLIRYVRVPADRSDPASKDPVICVVTGAAVHQMDLRVAFWSSRGWVYMVAAEEASNFQSVWNGKLGKVLVAKGNNLALSYKARELRLARIRESADLNATNLGSDAWSEVRDFDAVTEELRIGWVSLKTRIRMPKWL
jgi:hypothetical protein